MLVAGPISTTVPRLQPSATVSPGATLACDAHPLSNAREAILALFDTGFMLFSIRALPKVLR